MATAVVTGGAGFLGSHLFDYLLAREYRVVYDEAKRYAEAMTMAYHGQQGVDTCIARIFNTYGPRMRPHDGRAIPTFVRQAFSNQPITVFGNGSQTRSFCYVNDMA